MTQPKQKIRKIEWAISSFDEKVVFIKEEGSRESGYIDNYGGMKILVSKINEIIDHLELLEEGK